MNPPVPVTTTRRLRPISRRAALGGAASGLLALSGGAAWAVDRFLIEHVEVRSASSAYQSSSARPSASSSVATRITATSYSGPSGQASYTKVEQGTGSEKVTYFVADVNLSTGTALRSAFAKDTFGDNVIEVPSVMAERSGAVLAINGDYYGFRSSGIEIRNGAVFRDQPERQGLAIYRDGSFSLYDETSTSATRLLADGVWQTLSFGPGLVDGGQVIDGIDEIEVDTNIGNHSIQGNQPRTAIGMIEPRHLIAVIVDGRSDGYSRGVDMIELADIMQQAGCRVAYNLDGGGSSTLFFNGNVVNWPQGNGTERGTSDILYIGK